MDLFQSTILSIRLLQGRQPQFLPYLSIFASRPDISAPAITSEARTEFITFIIATALKYGEVYPDHVLTAFQIFRPTTDQEPTSNMGCAAGQSILEEMQAYAPHLSQFMATQAWFYAVSS
jgi:hypothetical protein